MATPTSHFFEPSMGLEKYNVFIRTRHLMTKAVSFHRVSSIDDGEVTHSACKPKIVTSINKKKPQKMTCVVIKLKAIRQKQQNSVEKTKEFTLETCRNYEISVISSPFEAANVSY